MPVTDADVLKVDLRWQVGSIGLACNIFQARVNQATPHSVPDLDVLASMGDWMTRVLEPMEPHIVVTCDVLDCPVYKKVGNLYNLIGPAPVVFTPGSVGDPLPSGVGALIDAYTLTSKVMGKKYLPGLSEVGQTAGLWVAGVLSAMLASAVEWITPFADLADPTTYYMPGVWSVKLSSFAIFAAHIATKDVPAYQRRRKAGVGA
jgi:hypothetical protein